MAKVRKIRRAPRGWKTTFLAALAESGNVSAACGGSGVSRSTAYRNRDRNPAFSEQWDDAADTAVDALELEARRRALTGTNKPVFQGGVQVGTIREYSDVLLIFLLKANRPEKYRDNFDLKRLVEQLADRQRDQQQRSVKDWIDPPEKGKPHVAG